jgi:ACS family glucarate transporter-like MFS transporter
MIAASPATQPTRLNKSQMTLVGLMIALSGMSYFDRTIMSIAGPGIMKEYGISETAMGAVYSAFLLSYTICMTPGGWLTDLFGPRRVLTATVLGTALLTGLTALCGSPGLGAIFGVVPTFLVVRFLFGVSASPIYPATGRMAANWIPMTSQGWVQALIMAGAALGAAFSPIVFSKMIAAYGWRVSFWIAAALAAALGIIWYWSVRDHPPNQAEAAAARPRVASQWKQLLTNRNLLLLTLGYFLTNYFEYIFFYWIYYYFGEIRHLGKSETALATTILFLTMAVMTPLGGKLSDRLVLRYGLKIGRRSVAMAGMGLSAVLLYLGASGFGVVATVALLSLAFGSAASSEGPYWATAIEISGEQAGAGCGIFNTGGNLGGMLAPVVTPMIAVHFGWAGGLYFGSLMVLIGMLTWLLIDPGEKIVASS